MHARQTGVRALIMQRVDRHVAGDTVSRAAAEALAAHVPDGGRVGAHCIAPEHAEPVPWPCRQFATLEDPEHYLDG